MTTGAIAGNAGSGPNQAAVHEDRSAFAFLSMAALFFVVSGLVALIIATKLQVPTLLGGVSWLTFGRLRPIHTNGMLFGWLLAADMGLCFYLVPRLCGVKL
nr:cbb3-type cytochrome c oxidase subunit I [Thermoanaerobaculia bacterium]